MYLPVVPFSQYLFFFVSSVCLVLFIYFSAEYLFCFKGYKDLHRHVMFPLSIFLFHHYFCFSVYYDTFFIFSFKYCIVTYCIVYPESWLSPNMLMMRLTLTHLVFISFKLSLLCFGY